jgi:sugar O-acyltransferase (sialic acid O-acetyltransferase NeuD family)
MTEASRAPRSDPTVLDRLYVFGAGGSGREIAWLAQQVWGEALDIVFVVDRPEFLHERVNGHPVVLVADVRLAPRTHYVAAVGDISLRRRAVLEFEKRGLPPGTVIHPRTEISRWVEIGPGSVVCSGAVLTTNVRLARHVHVNVGCTVSHDADIGDFATLSPGVHISGHVQVGADVFIGTGANVINGSPQRPLRIGDGAIIAAGACVTGDVEAKALVAGVPAQRKR